MLVCGASALSSVNAECRRALVIGLGEQQDKSWGKIHGDNDVIYVTNLLTKLRFTDITRLRNSEATKQGIVDAFEQLCNRCERGDKVYIHYSGHGQLITDLDGDEASKWEGAHARFDESWIPYDAYMTYCDNDRGEKHLTDDEIALLLTKIRKRIGPKGEITVVIDACHSGDATSAAGADDDEPWTAEGIRGVDVKFNIPLDPAADLRAKATEEKWLTISACQPYQLCSEITSLNVGRLTYALYRIGKDLDKLKGADLQEELERHMKAFPARIPQRPMIRGAK